MDSDLRAAPWFDLPPALGQSLEDAELTASDRVTLLALWHSLETASFRPLPRVAPRTAIALDGKRARVSVARLADRGYLEARERAGVRHYRLLFSRDQPELLTGRA